jgi:agmatine deiminase
MTATSTWALPAGAAAIGTGTVMPPEWASHARTWMEFPTANPVFGEQDSPTLRTAQLAWAGIANSLVAYEPVTMLVPRPWLMVARQMLMPGVRVCPALLQNAWLRDSGPTFVHAGDGMPHAVSWTFNGWGSESHTQWANWDTERTVAHRIAELADVPVLRSPLVTEGGGMAVDGEGTVLLTDSVQLDPHRNPGWTRAGVEAEVHARLGTDTAIWLPRGLTGDHTQFGTQGHIDMLVTFARPGVVLVHTQNDPGHPDFEVSRRTIELLSTARDARGRRLAVVPLPAPNALEVDGQPSMYSYVHHYVANDVVLMGAFDDPSDALAAHILRRVYRGREVILVDARTLFAYGGGVHAITLQQPCGQWPGSPGPTPLRDTVRGKIGA